MLFIVYVIFFSNCTCLSWGLLSHSSRSLSQAATDIWTIDSGISYTGSIGWKITGPSILSNTESTLLWMEDKASSLCLKTRGTHRSRHSKSMDNTSLNRSDIFILNDRDLPQSFQVPDSIDKTTHTQLLRPPCPAGQVHRHSNLSKVLRVMCSWIHSLGHHPGLVYLTI